MTTATVTRHDAPVRRARKGSATARARADRLALAIALSERGFAVFPLRAGSKVPAVRGDWEGLACSDPAQLRARGWPAGGNVGIACGPSALFVLDLDVSKAPAPGDAASADAKPGADEPRDGSAVLRELAAGRPIPPTLTVATPSGGTHLYYRADPAAGLRNTVARLGPLIDTRAAGGYVVGPGSAIGGRRYEITADLPIAPVPQWIVDELTRRHQPEGPPTPSPPPGRPDPRALRRDGSATAAYAAAALRNETERVLTAPIGTRNDTLNRSAYALGRLVGAGLLDGDQVTTELFIAARRNGLPAREASSTLASGLGAGIDRPRFPARPRPATAVRPAAAQAAPPLPPGPSMSDTGTSLPAPVISALKEVDRAYDGAALCAAPLVFNRDWRQVRSLVDSLRDVRDAARPAPSDARRAASLCYRIASRADALAERFPAPGRKRARSPLGKALRQLQVAADSACDALAAAQRGAAEPAAEAA